MNDATRPSRVDNLVEIAQTVAKRGTCSRLQVGAVIHVDGRILTTGYNGAPSGVEHCNHACNCLRQDSPIPVPSRLHHPDCAVFQPCLIAAHAERNAIDWAARHGIALLGSQLVVTDTPCAQCAGSIINAGITSVIAVRPYRDQTGVRMLEQARVSMILAQDVR